MIFFIALFLTLSCFCLSSFFSFDLFKFAILSKSACLKSFKVKRFLKKFSVYSVSGINIELSAIAAFTGFILFSSSCLKVLFLRVSSGFEICLDKFVSKPLEYAFLKIFSPIKEGQ